jgi:hypothetical protein
MIFSPLSRSWRHCVGAAQLPPLPLFPLRPDVRLTNVAFLA